MIYITSVHMVGGQGHERIGPMKWRTPDTGATGQSQTIEVASWLGTAGNEARVALGTGYVRVGAVNGVSPYVRTYADGQWTNNLLALPRY